MSSSCARTGARLLFCLCLALAAAPSDSRADDAELDTTRMASDCQSAAAKHFGVKPIYVETGDIGSSADGGYSLEGSAEKGAAGKQKFRCRWDAAGKFIDVAALAGAGE